MNIACYLTRTC